MKFVLVIQPLYGYKQAVSLLKGGPLYEHGGRWFGLRFFKPHVLDLEEADAFSFLNVNHGSVYFVGYLLVNKLYGQA